DHVALLDLDGVRVSRQAATLDAQIERQLRGHGLSIGYACSKHQARRDPDYGGRERLRDSSGHHLHLLELDCTSAIRLIVQRASLGAASTAGSPIADHNRRPNGSVNPAIGFHAACGRPSMPSDSQPFQGKSFSLALRMNMPELSPVSESYATFSI